MRGTIEVRGSSCNQQPDASMGSEYFASVFMFLKPKLVILGGRTARPFGLRRACLRALETYKTNRRRICQQVQSLEVCAWKLSKLNTTLGKIVIVNFITNGSNVYCIYTHAVNASGSGLRQNECAHFCSQVCFL
jgi:hypothetical protein